MKLSATFRLPRISFPKYRDALRQTLTEGITEAAFLWLNATTAEIPSWSGASRATFLKLATAIGFSVDIAVSSTSRFDRTGLGQSRSTGGIDIDKASEGLVSFNYGTTLEHLIYNEFNNANISPDPTLFGKLLKPGPYAFQEKGQKAFEQVASGLSLPDPTRSFTYKTIRVT